LKKVTIIGATGFGGIGLIELILRHPNFALNQIIAQKDVAKPLSHLYPHLKGFCDKRIESLNDLDYKSTDLVFMSTPDQVGMNLISKFYNLKIPVIDFSGDFRFKKISDYKIYAKNKGMKPGHSSKDLLKNTVYGLPEKYKKQIKKSLIIGNPGCFAIGMILALLPAIEADFITSDTIICNGITGVSGAGKNSGEKNLYPQRYENINSYKEGKHQHLVEVEQIINSLSSKTKKILFIPHLAPISRGIFNTIIVDFKPNLTLKRITDYYRDYYKNDPFVILSQESLDSNSVRGSNRCALNLKIDKRTKKLIITSVIDNLMKGQAGNALQNANLVFDFEETLGLNNPPVYP